MAALRSEEHTSELQSHVNLVCRLLLEKKNTARSQIALSLVADHLKRLRCRIRQNVLAEVTDRAFFFDNERLDGLNFLAFFFFNDTAATEIYTLSLHDALPI